MSERPEPKPHHHALLWAGVIGCLLLVGGFWIAGLPDVFKNGAGDPVFSDAGKELDRIVAETNKTLARFKEGQPASDERAKTLARFKETLTQLLSEAAVAESLTATTSTVITATTTE